MKSEAVQIESKVPIFIRLPESIVADLLENSKRFSKSKDDVTALAIHMLLSLPEPKRKKIFNSIPNKRAGAPLRK